MNWDANHAGFVLAAYVLTGLVVGLLVAWVVGRDRSLGKRLDRPERRDP